jgi:proteasome lid subunit RPN8/RPN11
MVENEKRRKYIMPTLHSHTHCQAAPSNAQTKAWQRVCLYNRTTKTTDKPADEKEHRSDNSVQAP